MAEIREDKDELGKTALCELLAEYNWVTWTRTLTDSLHTFLVIGHLCSAWVAETANRGSRV